MHFDCSSVFEVERVVLAGIDPSKIELVAQELTAKSLAYLETVPGHEHLKLIACSNHQLELILSHPKFKLQLEGIRLNPGFGSGETKKTTVAGPGYSFGIWSERLEETLAIIKKHEAKVKKIHSHIGAGNDPSNWLDIGDKLLGIVEQYFPECETLNLGGGFKIARMPSDKETHIENLAKAALERFDKFNKTYRTGKTPVKLEIEPGTFLVANAGIIIAEIIDIVSTVTDPSNPNDPGMSFIKVDTGLNDITRPSLYGAQHSIQLLSPTVTPTTTAPSTPHVIVGHCCESGDLLTCAAGNGELPE